MKSADNLFDKYRNHVNHYQTMGQNGQRLGPLV